MAACDMGRHGDTAGHGYGNLLVLFALLVVVGESITTFTSNFEEFTLCDMTNVVHNNTISEPNQDGHRLGNI